jgi:hypothetical protein
VYTVLVIRHEGKRQFWKSKCRCTWRDNIQTDFKEIRCEVVTGFNGLKDVHIS